MSNRQIQFNEDAASVPPKKRYRHVQEETKNSDDLSDNDGPPIVEPTKQPEKAGGKAWQMMAKMGYKDGGGLGAQSQGRSEPIDVKMRSRRRGLGAESKDFEPRFDVTWDLDQEQIRVEEEASWIPECRMDVPNVEEMEGWLKTGPKKLVIDNETLFCDPGNLSAMLESKSVFDELNDRDLRAARARANPFETIKGAVFQNRAAMKMANLDAVFDDLFTNPKLTDNKVWVPKDGNQLFYFADVCAGPGGFSEYVLWRRGWSAHGFGMTLRGKDDFKLEDFLAASPEMFEPFYGKNGIDGDGDITNPENLDEFKRFVLKQTAGQGVHLVMADGGFSVEGQENIQEILSKRLYLCQTLCAMNVLRPGGSFVCKLFDVFTPFSVGLMYLLWRSFDEVCLHKPHTSRPANSERYVICKRMRDDVDGVRAHLTNANLLYDQLVKEGRDKEEDVEELVPVEMLQNEEAFFAYVKESNEKLAERQTVYLNKYKAFAQNPNLQDNRQQDLREQCLRYWKVPDEKRPQPPKCNPSQRMGDICGNYDWITSGPSGAFDMELLDSVGEQLEEYRVLLRTDRPTIFLALGKRFVFRWEGTRWEDVSDAKLSIPRDTVVFAELAKEYRGEGKGQMTTTVLRVFDAYCLGGEHIWDKAFRERRRLLGKFCAAIHRESRPDLSPVCMADAWHLEQMPSLKNNFFIGKIRGGSRPMYKCPESTTAGVRGGVQLQAQGFIIYRMLRDDWNFAYSRHQSKLYCFNKKTGESSFDAHQAFIDFVGMHVNRRIWPDPKQRNHDLERNSNPEEELMRDLLRIGNEVMERKEKRAASAARSDSSSSN